MDQKFPVVNCFLAKYVGKWYHFYIKFDYMERYNMDYSKLQYLNVLFEDEIKAGEIHGASIRVVHNNQIVHDDRFGYANKEKKIPTAKDTIYRMYSMTKPITSVATMILYERGDLDLLSPVSDYLEGFKNQKVITKNGLEDAYRSVTIQDLLNMTSGVVYPDDTIESGRRMAKLYTEADEGHYKGNPMSTMELCNRIGEIPLEFQPGERWHYGASADILGAIVQIVSNMKYSDFLKKEIFEPLGMVDTAFYVPKEKQDRFAENYIFDEEAKKLVPFKESFLATYDMLSPPAFESGGAGLVSTIEDYSKFATMLVNGGSLDNINILGRKTVEYMATPGLTKEQAVSYNWDTQYGYSYGNLMRVFVDPIKATSNGSVGEFGWDGWTGNYFFIDPKENLFYIYMIQRGGFSNARLRRRMRQIIYSGI